MKKIKVSYVQEIFKPRSSFYANFYAALVSVQYTKYTKLRSDLNPLIYFDFVLQNIHNKKTFSLYTKIFRNVNRRVKL